MTRLIDIDDALERHLLTKLLTRGHLSVPEQLALPNRTASRARLAAIVTEELAFSGRFAVYGSRIVACAAGFEVVIEAETRTGAYDVVSRTRHDAARAAADDFLRRLFPGDEIDGVPLV